MVQSGDLLQQRYVIGAELNQPVHLQNPVMTTCYGHIDDLNTALVNQTTWDGQTGRQTSAALVDSIENDDR